MPTIGPFSFTTMDGRFNTASNSVIATDRGTKPGKRRGLITPFRTTEEFSTYAAAWQQAAIYRSCIGGVANAVDDGGIISPFTLVADVRTHVAAESGGAGALLETVWTLCPDITYGDAGQASQYVSAATGPVRFITTIPIPQIASTTISVGGVYFTTATGDMQWPISLDQRSEVVKVAKALGLDNVASPASANGGTLVCNVATSAETASFDLMRSCRIMVGTFADVELGGITVAGVAVRDCRVTWANATGLPSGSTQVATATWELETQDNSQTGEEINTVAVVQVATTWGQWQTIKGAVCNNADEGINAHAGTVSWLLDVGKTLRGRRTFTAEPVDYGGYYCRILIRQRNDGSPSVKGTVLVAAWWGTVLTSEINGGSAEGSATMLNLCAGLPALLKQVWFKYWYEISQDAITNWLPGEILPFNQVDGGDGGGIGTGDLNGTIDKSYTVHDRARVYTSGEVAHDSTLKDKPSPIRWTAHQIADSCLAAIRAQYPQGPRWTLTGQVAALDYTGEWTGVTKRCALDILAEVISPRFGTVFRFEVTGDAVALRVSTGVQADTVVPGLGTMPANDRQGAVDARGSDYVQYSLKRDATQEVDTLFVQGGNPWYCMTLGIVINGTRTSQFVKGWTATEETTWDSASVQQRDKLGLSHVWRRFRLAPDYSGGAFFSNSRNDLFKLQRETATSADLGTGGETGNFILGDGGPKPRSGVIRFTRTLPFAMGKDWSLVTGSGTADVAAFPGNQLDGPLLFGLRKDGSYELLTTRWMVQVEDQHAGIILGSNATDAAAIKAYLIAGNSILITLGVVHPLPWRMSWRRWPRLRDMERCLTLYFPELSYQLMVNGTVTGLSSPSSLIQTPNDVRQDWETVVNNGVPKLAPMLRLARLWYENRPHSLTYSRKGIIDLSTATAPGSMVTTATAPLDVSRAFTDTVNAVYTGRAYNFKAGEIATYYCTERILPGFDRFAIGKIPVFPRMDINKILNPYQGR